MRIRGRDVSIRDVIVLGLIVRVVLILYAELHDRLFTVKYTDIDYTVFTDAAQHVLHGGSPFDRAEYRYTPLVAYLVLPNHLVHPTFGKWLFALCDLLVAYVIHVITDSRSLGPLAAALWLFNPFTATISTRGSMESAYLLALFGSLYFLKKGSLALASVLFGLAVHWRLYPIVYVVPILLHLAYSARAGPAAKPALLPALKRIVLFGSLSGGTFILLSALFYSLYGQLYLDEYLLYHASRQDPKHNFSPYFYPLQLAERVHSPVASFLSKLLSSLAFVPQLGSCALIGVRYFRDVPFALLLQTVAFVAFNKVATAQYFVWWLVLIPVCLPSIRFTRTLRVSAVAWALSVLHWLFWAYLLEFRGLPVAGAVWFASLLYVAANISILTSLAKSRMA